MPRKSSADDRRTAIADAAISVLAVEGARGLTHRALDRHLQLPAGSTSYYFRTRQALLAAAVERLVFLDATEAVDIEMSAAGLASLCQRWSAGDRRDRSIARLELLLTAARSPQSNSMHAARELFLAGTEKKLRALASTNTPRLAAVALVALIEGLLIHGLVLGPLHGHELKRVTGRVLDAFADKPAQRKPSRRVTKRTLAAAEPRSSSPRATRVNRPAHD